MKNENTHNKVLILGAICVSIIAGVLSYKIADYKNQKDLSKGVAGMVDIISDDSSVNNKIFDALDASNDLLGTTTESNDPFTITSKDSVTSRLAKQVYSDYVHQEAGVSDLSMADIATNAVSQISDSDLPQSKYNFNDVSIIIGANYDEIRLYGNNFAEIYNRNMQKVSNNPQKYSVDLEALADLYQNISGELLKIKVPAEVASSHLAMVNNYQLMADSFRLIDQQSKDPVKSLLGARTAKASGEDNDQMFINILKTMVLYLVKMKLVTFGILTKN